MVVRARRRTHIEIYSDIDWNQIELNVNLQSPVGLNGDCLDTTDEALDVIVDPSGTSR